MKLSDFQLIEQINHLYHKTTQVILFTSICSYTLVLSTLFLQHKTLYLLLWYVSGITLLLLRYQSQKSFLTIELNLDNYKPWLNKLLIYSFLIGLSWGAILLSSVTPNHTLELVVLTFVYCAVTSTSSSYLGIYLPAYFAFTLPMLVLFLTRLIYLGESTYYIFAGLITLYYLFITLLARGAHESSKRISELTFQNDLLYEEVVEQKEVAESAVLGKSRFLASASHDLRQPLHAQGLFITALEYSNLPKKATQLTTKIKRSSEALNNLLNGLLDISRLESDSFENAPKTLEVKPLISNIYQEYVDTAAEKETELTLTADDDLFIHCDESLFLRLVRNLVDNAVKFTDNGEISILAQSNENHLLLSITDTGKGIPNDEIANIFNEFTQLNNPERDRQKGLGLGLAIVKRLITRMGVQLDVDSTFGEGSKFTLTIPLLELKEADIKTEDEALLFSNDDLKLLTFIVIDDEIDILEGMKLTIEHWGAKVVTATSADQAIENLDEQGLQPDFIVADFRLREGKNGIEAIEQLRKEFDEPIKAILVTGDTSSERIKLAESAQLPLLFKPVTSQVLRTTLDRILSGEKIEN